ncbi:MAG: hypothetical protein MJ051_06645 [Akkermansia sp.]|nr:hypothetical protein [Akkermansia sp.]
MGVIAATANLAGKAVEATQQHEQSKAYRRAAAATEQEANRRAAAMTETAMENQRRAQRNARMQLASARADAGASNLLNDGSVAVRERDLATRLEDEINNRTDAALQEADTTRRQGALDAWNLRVQSRNAHNSMLGTALGAAGGLTKDLFGNQGVWPGGKA